MVKLILLRGNSGSGKTTLAKALQTKFGTDQCLLLQQDVIRRELLHANDHPGSPAVPLIADLVAFGQQHYSVVILEGILRRDVYGAMLTRTLASFPGATFVYYLNVPFAITWQLNLQKASPFSRELLQSWWLPDDQLSAADRLLPSGDTQLNLRTILAAVAPASAD